ncbi:MAG: response regulator [Thiobacillus sp.]|nr:response regulator [Thiobacillus sp.]
MFTRNALLARRLIFTVGSGFALALILIGALTALGLRQLGESNVRLEAIVNENSVKSRMASQMRGLLRDRAISMLSIVVTNDPFEKDQEMLRFYQSGSVYQKVRLELDTLIHRDEERKVLVEIDRLTALNRPVMVRTVDLALEGYTFLAFEVLQQEAIPLQRDLVMQLDKLIKIQQDMTQQAVEEAQGNFLRTRSLMLALGILAVLVAAIVAWAVVRRTARLAAATEREGTKFQTLFETNTDGIVILDDKGFIDCNKATLDMFHMGSKEEFLACRPGELGRNVQACGTTAELLASSNIQLAIRQGHAFFDWIARRPDGTTFPSHVGLHAMTLDGRRVIQAIMRDISAQRETEDTLKRARDAALSATEMKSQFVANVSHEIRTPMNGIMGMTQLLMTTPLTARQKDYVETVARSADALMGVINDLLDFSKIEAGRLTLEEIDFDLGAQLRDILDLYIPRADAKQLALRLERGQGLPAWVRGDPLRIRQILLNLLDNAIKFTQQGEVRLVVETPEGMPGHLRFSVRDTGPGMTSEVQDRVFQAFAQGDGSVTRRFGGTGLGLTICRQLAELMGGSLTLESTPGLGSAFHLTLPLPKARPGRQAPAEEAPGLSFPGVRVLVAEDNPVNQKLAGYMLENLGVEVLMAEDGKVAYETLKREQDATRPVDLVLMDFQMPEWDGLTATRAIRAREHDRGLPRLPVLALTANAMAGFERTCLEAGMDGVLIKPLKEEELAAALDQWLPGRVKVFKPSRGPAVVPTPGPVTRLFKADKIRKLCHDGPARIEEMLSLFIDSTEPLLEKLSLAIHAEDAHQAARQAHQIKGAAAYLGAEEMTRHAAATEQRAKAGDCPGCTDAMEELETAFIALRLEIEDEIKRGRGG